MVLAGSLAPAARRRNLHPSAGAACPKRGGAAREDGPERSCDARAKSPEGLV
jgi:hypothetical protein